MKNRRLFEPTEEALTVDKPKRGVVFSDRSAGIGAQIAKDDAARCDSRTDSSWYRARRREKRKARQREAVSERGRTRRKVVPRSRMVASHPSTSADPAERQNARRRHPLNNEALGFYACLTSPRETLLLLALPLPCLAFTSCAGTQDLRISRDRFTAIRYTRCEKPRPSLPLSGVKF